MLIYARGRGGQWKVGIGKRRQSGGRLTATIYIYVRVCVCVCLSLSLSGGVRARVHASCIKSHVFVFTVLHLLLII